MVSILDRWTGAVICTGETVREAVEAAVIAGLSLTGADLTGADLTGANLDGADLTGANLDGAYLDGVKDDLFSILDRAAAEVPALLAAIHAGGVDGSTYSAGRCTCLVGTIATARGCPYTELAGITPDGGRPAERWFLAIRPGCTPDKSPIAAIAVTWIEEWQAKQVPAMG